MHQENYVSFQLYIRDHKYDIIIIHFGFWVRTPLTENHIKSVFKRFIVYLPWVERSGTIALMGTQVGKRESGMGLWKYMVYIFSNRTKWKSLVITLQKKTVYRQVPVGAYFYCRNFEIIAFWKHKRGFLKCSIWHWLTAHHAIIFVIHFIQFVPSWPFFNKRFRTVTECCVIVY